MIVHEVMGRDCGWLTAATAAKYRERLSKRLVLPEMGVTKGKLDVHAVYIPEVPIDLESEARRLRTILDKNDCVNLFISEGAGVKDIVARMEEQGQTVQRDAFGHVKLDSINPGKYFADNISKMIDAEKAPACTSSTSMHLQHQHTPRACRTHLKARHAQHAMHSMSPLAMLSCLRCRSVSRFLCRSRATLHVPRRRTLPTLSSSASRLCWL